MTNIAEIEAAIGHLPIEEVREIATWLEEYQITMTASEEMASSRSQRAPE